MLLREVLFQNLDIAEAKADGPKDVLGKTKFMFAVADTPNANKRVYKKKLLTTEIARLQNQLKAEQSLWGSPEHPEGSAVVKIADISHRLTKVWMDEKGQCWGEAEILATSKGKDLAVILRKGKIGVSLRGTGTTTEQNGMSYVNDDLAIAGIDFAMSPSFESAYAAGLYESAEIQPGNGKGEESSDAEIEAMLDGLTDEEAQTLVEMPEEEFEKMMAMSDDELEAYANSMEEQKLTKRPLNEIFQSLDKMIRDAAKAVFGEAAWVKDFSQDEVVLTISNPAGAGSSPDVLVKLSYQLSDEGIEFTSDPVVVNKVEDYEQVTEQSLKTEVQKEQKLNENNPDLKAGELSEQEMKLSGYTKRFAPNYLKAGELSEQEMRLSGHSRRFAAPDPKLSELEKSLALTPKERESLRKKE